MSKITFTTDLRNLKQDKLNQLRREGVIPGNVYISGKDSVAIKFSEKKFIKLYQEAGDTSLVYLSVDQDSQEKPTLIDEVQVNPVTEQVLHVSFKEVNLKEKIEAEVPVEIVGEFDVKESVLVQVRNSVVVEALPSDLPEKFVVDVATLTEIGQSISLSDLDFDKTKVSLVEVEADEDWEKPVVIVQEQREEIEEEVEEIETELISKDGEETKEAVEETKTDPSQDKSEAKKD